MRTSESIVKIAPDLVEAQSKMGHAIKNSTNPHFKSDYADLVAIVELSRPILAEYGLAVIHAAESESPDTVTITARVIHASGEWIESSLMLRPSKADPQGVGSAITYGRRYTLAAILGIATADDDGNAASGHAGGNGAPTPPRRETPKQPTNDPSKLFIEAVRAWAKPTNTAELAAAATTILKDHGFTDKASVPAAKWPELTKHVQGLKGK